MAWVFKQTPQGMFFFSGWFLAVSGNMKIAVKGMNIDAPLNLQIRHWFRGLSGIS